MTISKIKILSSMALGAIALSLLAGCGGGGGGSVSQSNQNFPSGIYLAMNSEYRVRSYTDMSGGNPKRFNLPANTFANYVNFDSHGHMYVGTFGKIYRFWSPDDVLPAFYGEVGNGVGQFGTINAIDFDSQDRIYIMDPYNNRIVRMDDITGVGWTELDLTPYLLGAPGPMSMCLDSSNRIYLASWNDSRILRFDNLVDTIPEVFGSHGSGMNQFDKPIDISVDQSGKIYIVDPFNHRIVRLDDMTGTNWKTYGTSGSGVGQFNYPSAVCTDTQGRIYITDGGDPQRLIRINDMTGAGWVTLGDSPGPEDFLSSPFDVLVR